MSAVTLVTGVPGAGKTLFMLDRLMKENIPEKGQSPRPVYVYGIPDLDYQFFGARRLEDPQKWHDCPDGSFILISEAQEVFPQRSAKDDVPDYVKLTAKTRHKGFSLFLDTQDPMNVDVFIRRVVGRHYFLHRLLNREVATVYEFDHYEPTPLGFHEKKQAVSVSAWRYPKKLYGRYKSATMHTYKARLPWKLVAVPIIALGSVGLLWYGISHVVGQGSEKDPEIAVNENSGLQVAARDPERKKRDVVVWTMGEYVAQFQPVVPGLQHSAPFYQPLFAEVETFPRPMCISFEIRKDLGAYDCKCFTQQMTHYDTSKENCFYWVNYGWFDPTLSDEDLAAGARAEAKPDRARLSQ